MNCPMPIPQLGNWFISFDELLGRGGYASVYYCHKVENSDIDGAIKIYENPFFVNTFEREIKALDITAECPGTPKLLDYGRRSDGKLCIVTERIPGITLEQQLRRHGPLSLQQTYRLLENILEIIEYCHSKTLLHKDIKPSNVLINGNNVCLLDWGVSENFGNGRSESIRANQDYVAPECYYGHHEPATDFYSLAWIIIFALTGLRPYHCNQISDKDYRVVAHCIERPELPEKLPSEIIPLLYGWLRKNPSQRPINYRLSFLLNIADGTYKEFLEFRNLKQLQWEFSYLYLSARHGIPYAQCKYALHLLETNRAEEARYWLLQCHKNGYATATRHLARLSLREGDITCGYNLMREAARAGDAGAQASLGRALTAGKTKGVEGENLYWLEMAANQGNRQAQFEYANLLTVMPGQREAACFYYNAAVERGHHKADECLNRLLSIKSY